MTYNGQKTHRHTDIQLYNGQKKRTYNDTHNIYDTIYHVQLLEYQDLHFMITQII